MSPDSAEALHILAVVLYQAGRPQEAVDFIRRAIALEPANYARYNDLGEMLRACGDTEEAIQAYRKAISLNPGFAMAHNNQGVCLHGMGKRDEARKCYETAIACDAVYAEAHANLGMVLWELGDIPGAETSLRNALRIHPHNFNAASRLGDCYLRQQRMEEAIAQFQAVVQMRPEDAEAVSTLGKAYLAQGKHLDEAERCFRRAIALQSENALHHFRLGEVLRQRGQMQDALPCLQEAMRLRPYSHEIAANLGNLLRALGQLDEAEHLLREAITWKPEYSPLHNNLGMICIETGRVKEAFDCFNEAIRLEPTSAEAHGNLANTYWQMGDYVSAMAGYQKTLQLRPDYPSARFSMSIMELSLGQFESGWANYRHRPNTFGQDFSRFPKHPLDADLTGQRLYIHYDQGIGDEIFFLRFAAELKRRGAWIAYRPFPKIASLMSRLPFVDQLVGTEPLASAAYDHTCWVSDLAYLCGMKDDSPCPPSIALRATPGARREVARRLAVIGEGPYLGITWRAGMAKGAITLWSALRKEVSLEMMAQAIRGFPGRILILQRNVTADELSQISKIVGCPVHDFSDLNDNLDQMLALLDELDEHVCVSNTNVHLRAALGKTSRVLVPHPPDWRWMAEGETSPWFPDCQVYRQTVDGNWGAALERLREALRQRFEGAADSVWDGPIALEGKLRPSLLWLTTDAPQYVSGTLVSNLASMRYRALMPLRELRRRGYQAHVRSFNDVSRLAGQLDADFVIISKTLDPRHLEVAKMVKNQGKKLVVDLCDNHFQHPEIGAYHRKLVALADVLIASTPQMAQVIFQETGLSAQVVGDPYEGEQGKAHFNPGERLNVLWFGSHVNLDTLMAALPDLAKVSLSKPINLHIVTKPNAYLEKVIDSGANIAPATLQVSATAWSQETTWAAIRDCDLVMIPTLAHESKVVKSPNRMVEALWGGRFVVAGDIPSYREFGDWAWIGNNMGEGLAWALAHQSEIPVRIEGAQRHIAVRYSTSAITDGWETVFCMENEPAMREH